MKKRETFESFLIRIRKEKGKWVGTIICIKNGFSFPIAKLSDISVIIKKFVKEGEEK
ncbi:MAG: hypothetical protein J7L03_00315 [Caldisericaceae bacterium]|jgi:predicted transcriptional regulator YheO|nr:hypothetical protein [Caldisericaceae bacterium]